MCPSSAPLGRIPPTAARDALTTALGVHGPLYAKGDALR